MRAVAEATGRGECGHVVERLLETLGDVPELQLAQAWRVEHEPASRQRQQLTMARRVPPATVACNLGDRHHGSAREVVHDRRLSDAR